MRIFLDEKNYNGIWIGKRKIFSTKKKGNSNYLNLPSFICDEYGIIPNTDVEIIIVGLPNLGENDEENSD